jgi:hypothetical protein
MGARAAIGHVAARSRQKFLFMSEVISKKVKKSNLFDY